MDDEIFNKRVQELNKEEERMLSEYGWYVHFVIDGDFNGLANIHTHGLEENFNHPDLQIVIPISPETAHPVLIGIVEQIKEGKKFEGGTITNEVLQGMEALFLSFEEGGRTVLRLLLPDSKGNLPTSDECDPLYKKQLEILPD